MVYLEKTDLVGSDSGIMYFTPSEQVTNIIFVTIFRSRATEKIPRPVIQNK